MEGQVPMQVRYQEIGIGKKRKVRKNGKLSRWGPVPKRRRWGGKKDEAHMSEELKEIMNSNLDATGTELSLLKIRLQECTTRLNNPTAYMLSIPENERSPSPLPIYDNKGVRLNTRTVRVKSKLTAERDGIISRVLQLNPDFKPPSDWKKPRLEKKIFVPVDEYPDYNFFGLIIGPGGTTIKRLQKETNTRIQIRGHGSFVEGKANRIPQFDDADPMHVLISGINEDEVEKAGELVEALLVPITTSESELKARELRQLALMQGQMVSVARCRICGGAGHPVWKCPERSGDRWTPANVQCAICGELSHVTADCKLARNWNKTQVQNASKAQTLEMEYNSFMKDMTGGTAGSSVGPARPVAAITNSYSGWPPAQPQMMANQYGYGATGAQTGYMAYPPPNGFAYPPPVPPPAATTPATGTNQTPGQYSAT